MLAYLHAAAAAAEDVHGMTAWFDKACHRIVAMTPEVWVGFVEGGYLLEDFLHLWGCLMNGLDAILNHGVGGLHRVSPFEPLWLGVNKRLIGPICGLVNCLLTDDRNCPIE